MKFNETQKRWPTIEQEAFGIFFCVQHWADLLIRQKFRIYTDHRNLTFVLNAESKKLTRWRLALQEFVFDIVHIAGEDNVEADYLSRVQFDWELIYFENSDIIIFKIIENYLEMILSEIEIWDEIFL